MGVHLQYNGSKKGLNVEEALVNSEKRKTLLLMVDQVLKKRQEGVAERSTLVRYNIHNAKNFNGLEQNRINNLALES